MRGRNDVSDEKLRGGFYSPDVLVDLCLKRSKELLGPRSGLRVLEPCCGDGAFLRGLERSHLRAVVQHVEAIEILQEEAQKSAQALSALGLSGRVINDNVLRWSIGQSADYDLLIANPPYVRFQFIDEADKQRSRAISAELGIAGSSVSNLWISVFLLSLTKIREGGVFSVILPTEFLTGISANSVRNWLIQNTTDLTIDLFKPGSFPSVLQEVLVLSGRISREISRNSATIDFHDHNGETRSWCHTVTPGSGTWTNYLLTPEQNSAFAAASSMKEVSNLGSVARFSVSTVTGANGYFCVKAAEVDKFDLHEWVLPLLPRSRYAPGLLYALNEHASLSGNEDDAWMLSFAADKRSPLDSPRAKAYIALGKALEIDQRFKCRVRSPWFRVPVVPAGELLLSKRSNRFPRVISNHASVVTTDTIYRGNMLAGASVTADDFTTGFHNSLTMLSAEVEGRSFGGGVLELVPSEVSSLQVVAAPGLGSELVRLDKVARTSTNPESLIEATDEALVNRIPALDSEILDRLSEARFALMDRRLQRTHSKFFG